MFTLKLYQHGPLLPNDRTVIVECAGVWVDRCDNDVLHIHAFRKTVGVADEDGTPEFYVGGRPTPEQDAVEASVGGNCFSWGVLENALGKTTEMFR